MRMLAILGTFAAVLAAATHGAADGQDAKPTVSLLLEKATAEQSKDEILFRCEVVIDNASGRDLKVKSKFNSAFDYLEIVVTKVDGTILAQQIACWHKSPYSIEGRDYTLAKGRNRETLVFPIVGLSLKAKSAKVRLIGSAGDYPFTLSSETLEIPLK